MKIIYTSPSDTANFDIDRYMNCLWHYDPEVTEEEVNAALSKLHYDPMHVSVLVSEGVKLIHDDAAAKKFYDDHEQWFHSGNFERLRRITGYLVGSLERWNDGKRAEEHDRVKHGMENYDNEHGQFTLEQKAQKEAEKLEAFIASEV